VRPSTSDEGQLVGFADLVDGGDVRVVHGGRAARFAQELAAALGVGGQLGAQHLQSDVPIEPGVEGLPDDPHPPFADLLDAAIVRDHQARFHRSGLFR
jgi:hypothetical protein